jgi:hypothetical protein
MVDEELNKKVAAVLKDERGASPTAYDDVLRKLRSLAAAITASLAPSAIEARVEQGYDVNLGQQYNVVIRVPKTGFRHVLFRAYLPVAGFPVSLDLFEDKHPRCERLEDLEAEILEFLGHPDVKQRLLALKDEAA